MRRLIRAQTGHLSLFLEGITYASYKSGGMLFITSAATRLELDSDLEGGNVSYADRIRRFTVEDVQSFAGPKHLLFSAFV